MSHEYSAENHDWDMTLRAAYDLFQIGQVMDKQPRKGTVSMGFSCFVGSMLLSFAAIESFSASVAFSMPKSEKYKHFDFERYRRCSQFWGKIELLFFATGQKIDKSQGLFQSVSKMQKWRNLVTHSSPYRIGPVEVSNTTSEPGKLHKPNHHKEYIRQVNVETAAKFYQSACDYIDLLKERSEMEPHASATYKIGEN